MNLRGLYLVLGLTLLSQTFAGYAFAGGKEEFYAEVAKERAAVCEELEDPQNKPLVQLPASFSPCASKTSHPLPDFIHVEEGYMELNVPHPDQAIQTLENDPNIKARWSQESPLLRKTKYLAGISAVFMFAFLKQLPEDTTGWDRGFGDDYLDNWVDNIKEGPVFDKDDWQWNYLAHPLVGSWYYTLCRNSNYTGAQCLLYNFLISTVMWEYGLEAFEEPPSVQDLLITPLAGALIGEISYILIQEIKKNGGQVLGSKSLGKFVMAALAPVDTLVNHLQAVFEPILKEHKIHGYLEIGPRRKITNRDYYLSAHPEFDDDETAVMLKLRVPLPVDWDRNLLRATGN